MRPTRNLTSGLRNCKIKPVDPAFRSVSTPRQPKDLRAVRPVNPKCAFGCAKARTSASMWSPKGPTVRLRSGVPPRAWSPVVRPASWFGNCVGRAFRLTLLEVA
jgi:hypothetical protein